MENYVFIVFVKVSSYESFTVFDSLFKAKEELEKNFEKFVNSDLLVEPEEKVREQFKKNEKHWFDINLIYDDNAYGCIRKRKVQ